MKTKYTFCIQHSNQIILISRETPVRTHLKSVYACLTMSIMSAAAGAYTHMFTSLLRGGGIGKASALFNQKDKSFK